MFPTAKLKLTTVAALSLLPLLAPGESHLTTESQAGSRHSVATAHVMFTIVIPQELAMEFQDTEPRHIRLTHAAHRAAARVESCVPAGAESRISCTVSMP